MTESSSTQQQRDVDHYNCGFCLQKPTSMEQPKQLPCSHVFCLPCLQGDAKKECPVCERAFDSEWTGTTVYDPINKDEEKTETQNTDHIKCDVCSTEKAVCFCVTCEQKLCDQHFKLHEQSTVFFTTKHSQLDISVYMSDPVRYNARQCEIHSSKRLTSACFVCHRLFCDACKPEKLSCHNKNILKSEDGIHRTCPIPVMASDVRSRLQSNIKEIADKVAEGLNLEKKIWTSLDDAESYVKNTVSEIDAAVKQATASIQEKADNLKAELSAYLQRCKNNVEDHCANIGELRGRFESSWMRMSQKLSIQHDTEVITEYYDLKSDIQLVLEQKYVPVLNLGQIILSDNNASYQGGRGTPGDAAQFSLSLKEPDLITFSYKDKITKDGMKCFTVAWSGKSLFYGMDRYIFKHHDLITEEEELQIEKSAYCVRPAGCFAMAILCYNKNLQGKITRQVRIGRQNMLSSDSAVICEYEQSNSKLSHLSIHQNYVATCDIVNREVKVFTSEGEQVTSIGSNQLQRPWGVLLLATSALVTDYRPDGVLYKYNLISDSDPVWKCEDLIYPTGICMDSKGYIYVTSNTAKLIYLISPEGKLMKKLTCAELEKTEYVNDISLSDDGETLALACREEGVKLFSITTYDC